MAVAFVDIGDTRVWLCAYNPRDAKSRLCCDFVVARARELLAGTTPEQVHAWAKEHLPHRRELIEYIEAGGGLPRDTEIGRLTVTPGEERYELPIITHLLSLRQGGPNGHAV